MYLYQERFKEEVEKKLAHLRVTDARILTWFRTTYLRCMRKIVGNHVGLFIGSADVYGNRTLLWSEAPVLLREAIMRDEEVRELLPSRVRDSDLAYILRAMDQLLKEQPDIKSLSGYDYSSLMLRGQHLQVQDKKAALKEEAKRGMKVMFSGNDDTGAFEIVGLFNGAALAYIGHDLMNCLRDVQNSPVSLAAQYLSGGYTFFGLRRGGRFVSVAEAYYWQANPDTDKSAWKIKQHTKASNKQADPDMISQMTVGLNAIYGALEGKQPANGWFKKVFKLNQSGKPTLETHDRRMPTTLRRDATLFPHQHLILDSLGDFNLTLDRSWREMAERVLTAGRGGKTRMMETLFAHVDSVFAVPRPILDTQDDPLVDVTRPPELRGKRQQQTITMLKHRAGQRQMADRPVPKLLLNMQRRLNDTTFERQGTNMVMTPRETRIGSADAVGIVAADSEGDRRANLPVVLEDSDRVEPGLRAGGLRRGELFIVGARSDIHFASPWWRVRNPNGA